MTGPGSVGLYGDSQLFYLVSCNLFFFIKYKLSNNIFNMLNLKLFILALITLCFILLHTCWSITLYLSISLYNDFKPCKFFLSVFIVIGSHIFVSGLVKYLSFLLKIFFHGLKNLLIFSHYLTIQKNRQPIYIRLL
jgi:hypothetical protein